MFGFKSKKNKKKTDEIGIAELRTLAGENYKLYKGLAIALMVGLGFICIGFLLNNEVGFYIAGGILICLSLFILFFLIFLQIRKNKHNNTYEFGITGKEFYDKIENANRPQSNAPKFVTKASDFSNVHNPTSSATKHDEKSEPVKTNDDKPKHD